MHPPPGQSLSRQWDVRRHAIAAAHAERLASGTTCKIKSMQCWGELIRLCTDAEGLPEHPKLPDAAVGETAKSPYADVAKEWKDWAREVDQTAKAKAKAAKAAEAAEALVGLHAPSTTEGAPAADGSTAPDRGRQDVN